MRRRFSACTFLDISTSNWFDFVSFLMLCGSSLILCKTFWMTKGDNDVILQFLSSDSIIMKRGKT